MGAIPPPCNDAHKTAPQPLAIVRMAAMPRAVDATVAAPRPLMAVVIRIFAALVLATMSALVKLASESGVNLPEIIFWRQAITLPIVLAWTLVVADLASLRPKRFSAHFVRALYGITGMALVYGAVTRLPLAEATTLNFTAPIFAVILAMLLLKEQIGRYRWAAVAIGFVGILIVTQPGNTTIDPFGVAIGLGGAFMIALTSIQIQDLNRTESAQGIVFWFCLLTLPLLSVLLPFFSTAHDTAGWLLLLGVGLTGAAGQLLLTTSLRFGSAATVIVMDYTALIWATGYGWLFWDRLPGLALWLGAPLIILAGTIIVLRERHLALRKTVGGT